MYEYVLCAYLFTYSGISCLFVCLSSVGTSKWWLLFFFWYERKDELATHRLGKKSCLRSGINFY